MTASQMRIAETIDAFYGDAGTRDGVSRSYKQAVEDLDAETIKALDGPYRYVFSISILSGSFFLLSATMGLTDPFHSLQDGSTRAHFALLCLLPRYK